MRWEDPIRCRRPGALLGKWGPLFTNWEYHFCSWLKNCPERFNSTPLEFNFVFHILLMMWNLSIGFVQKNSIIGISSLKVQNLLFIRMAWSLTLILDRENLPSSSLISLSRFLLFFFVKTLDIKFNVSLWPSYILLFTFSFFRLCNSDALRLIAH